MKRAALTLVLLLAARAGHPDELRLAVHESLLLEPADVTAAFAVDATVVDVSLRGGRVTLAGRAPGSTRVTLVRALGVETHALVVNAPSHVAISPARPADGAETSLDSRYDGQSDRLTSGLEIASRRGGRTVRARLQNVQRMDAPARGLESRSSWPVASLELAGPQRSITVLDAFVDQSVLTFDEVQLRGLHYRQGPLELHAGVTSTTFFQDLALPVAREEAMGVAWRARRGAGTWTPTFTVFPAAGEGTHPFATSLGYARGEREDPLRWSAEVGWGGRPAAAFSLEWEAGDQRLSLEGWHRPRDFASLAVGRPRGTFAQGDWVGRAGARLTLSASGSFSRYELPAFEDENATARGDARFWLGGRWSVTGGAAVARFTHGGRDEAARSLTVPAGLSYDAGRLGLSALYRYQRNTATNHGGHGGRLGLRGSWSAFHASAFVDRQSDAPTVSVILGEDARLARALTELGLSVRTPEDLARLLRENAELVELGHLSGFEIDFTPARLQTGAEVVWSSPGARHRLRVQGLYDRIDRPSGEQRTRQATLSWTGFVAGMELSAGLTWWSSDHDAFGLDGTAVQLGLRKSFDGAPRLPLRGGGTLAGYVYREDPATGERGPLGGVEVRLDSGEVTRTDSRGRFSFSAGGRNPRRASVVLPAGAFFTTPSSRGVSPSTPAVFGIAFGPARLVGRVRNDAGGGVAGVGVRLRREGVEHSAVTRSDGSYEFAVGPGAYELSLDDASLPAGYDLPGDATGEVRLERGAALPHEHVLTAHRSLGGRVLGPARMPVSVRLEELDRTAAVAEDGSYLFRDLPAGAYTLCAAEGGRRARRTVTVPEEPAILRGVDLLLP